MSTDALRFCFKGTGQVLIYRLGPVPNSLLHCSAGPPAARTHRSHSFPQWDLWLGIMHKQLSVGLLGLL